MGPALCPRCRAPLALGAPFCTSCGHETGMAPLGSASVANRLAVPQTLPPGPAPGRGGDAAPARTMALASAAAIASLGLASQVWKVTLGRDPASAVAIDDRVVSARYARIGKSLRPPGLFVEGLGSTDGTCVDIGRAQERSRRRWRARSQASRGSSWASRVTGCAWGGPHTDDAIGRFIQGMRTVLRPAPAPVGAKEA